jgi:hypothetical protein
LRQLGVEVAAVRKYILPEGICHPKCAALAAQQFALAGLWKNTQDGPSPHLPGVFLGIEAAVGEDVPLLFVKRRLVSTEIVSRPARLLAE